MRSCNLVIMDAGPLIRLAAADRLDLLLHFHLRIFIPDEVYFEAVDKQAWEHRSRPTPDKLRLQKWIEDQQAARRVFCPETLVGQIARQKRDSGEYRPELKNHRKGTGELAAHDFFNNRDEWNHANEPAVLLMDDRPAIERVKLQALDVYVLTTFALLLALEKEGLISSAEAVWGEIAVAIPKAAKLDDPDPAGSVRGDTEFVSALRRPGP